MADAHPIPKKSRLEAPLLRSQRTLLIRVEEEFSDARRWDQFVESHPESRFCHLYGYRCLKQVYGYRPRYFAFLKGEQIVAVLPAFEARSLFLGRRLVSQPFCEYGGLLLNPAADVADLEEIFGHLRQFLTERGISGLELHGRQGIHLPGCERFLTRCNTEHCAYLPLEGSLEEIWSNVVTYQVRKAVQKAERCGLTTEERSDPEVITRDFYPSYLGAMARLGVPPHSLDYYLRCQAAFGDRMRIFWAIHKGRPIAGLLGFSCGRRVSILNIVSDERFWELRPNDLVHWAYIRWAHTAGFKVFDFGSVRYEGQLRYKQKWGCTIDDHGYFFLSAAENSSKTGTFDSSSPTMQRFSKLWSRYMPGPVGRFIGPFVRKHLVR